MIYLKQTYMYHLRDTYVGSPKFIIKNHKTLWLAEDIQILVFCIVSICGDGKTCDFWNRTIVNFSEANWIWLGGGNEGFVINYKQQKLIPSAWEMLVTTKWSFYQHSPTYSTIHLMNAEIFVFDIRVARFFLVQHTKMGRNWLNDHKNIKYQWI
jgi:hypothetical protein